MGGTAASGYQTTAGLSSNVATLTANNTSFVGTVAAANVVSNAQLSGNLANYVTATNLTNNLANYQTTAGLSSNVATLAANNASYLGGVAAASYVNTSGAYTIGGVLTHNADLIINNNKSFKFQTINTSAYVSLIQQNDDNFVFYSTNTSGGQRAIYAVFANSITSSFQFQVPVLFNSSVTLGSQSLSANGGTGTAGQVLTTNGTATYWSTPAAGGGTYTFSTGLTNTSNTITVNTTYIATLSANNTTYVNGKTESNLNVNSALTSNNSSNFNGQAAAYYTNATNITTGTLPWAQAPTNTVNTSAAFTFTGVHTHSANVSITGTTKMTGVVDAASANTLNQTLTDGVTVSWDASLGQVATLTLAGNRTIANPTNMKVATYILYLVQDATGSRTITWGSAYKWPGGVAPVLSTGANKRDIISFISDGTNMYGTYIIDVR